MSINKLYILENKFLLQTIFVGGIFAHQKNFEADSIKAETRNWKFCQLKEDFLVKIRHIKLFIQFWTSALIQSASKIFYERKVDILTKMVWSKNLFERNYHLVILILKHWNFTCFKLCLVSLLLKKSISMITDIFNKLQLNCV